MGSADNSHRIPSIILIKIAEQSSVIQIRKCYIILNLSYINHTLSFVILNPCEFKCFNMKSETQN